MNEYIENVLKSSYYTQIKKILKKGIIGHYKLFLLHFDAVAGPCLATSRKDDHFAGKLKIETTQAQDEEFNELGEELAENILRIFDSITNEDIDIETILRKENIWVFFRYFEVKNTNARGGSEMFMLAFITEKVIESRKLNEIKSLIKEKLQMYFELFNKGYIINQKIIKIVLNQFKNQATTPTEEQIINEYYDL